jgi:predicted permease
MVGQAPVLGRAFREEDDRAESPPVAIIAHTVWRNRYGGDPGVIGRVVRINDIPMTIIGVMPEGFHFPAATEIWVPNARVAGPSSTLAARRGNRAPLILAFGRLADGATLARARAELDTVAGRLARDYPATNDGISVAIDPIADLYWGGEFGMRQLLLLVMGAVSVVLLVACVNVANLMLARAVQRSREIAIRASLGATRARLVRQLFVESLLLAAIAGALGYGLSLWGVRIFNAAFQQMWPNDGITLFWLNFTPDARVYTFLASLCLGSSLVFGLAPALHISRTNNDVLKDGGRTATGGVHTRRWTGALIVGQLALTVVLLGGAGLMVRSFLAVYQSGRVLDTSNVMTMQLSLGARKYPEPEQIKQFHRQLDEQLSAMRAFSAVTVASDIPMMTMINALRQLTIEGRPPDDNLKSPPTTAYLYVGPRYFETIGLRLIRGRAFTENDGAVGHEAAIVNQRFASMFFSDGDPIGQRIRLANATAPNTPQPWLTIIGVVPTVPQIIFREPPEPVVYVSLRGEPAPHRFVSIIARAIGDRAAVVAAIREAVHKVDPNLAGYFARTLDEVAATGQWRQRMLGALFAAMAAIALLIASVGLYAVTAHGVTQRTPEIGIRVALGAQASQVVWLFVRRTVAQLAIGLVLGLAGAMVVGRQLQQFLVRTPPADPIALGLVSVLLIAVATAASIWPARRAARVDPATALRCE